MKHDFYNKYSYKIKSIQEVTKKIKSMTGRKKIILCHGVFDIIHPGHVRHFSYAKSKADILVVSLTTDRYIKKGTYRPHVPEKLRALNLAAFEMVDFVVIDNEATPLKNLKILKPDFFAKGFEYFSDNISKETLEEIDVVKSYGGKMIFTPGDVVYSSSKIINTTLPNIQIEKLLSLMEFNKITFEDLKKTVKKFEKISVHVVGDTIIDTYTRGAFIGGQTKTPTFSILQESQENYVGGAGVVAQHVRSGGAKVIFSTILGNDSLKNFVKSVLQKLKIKLNLILDETRPTTNKNVIISGQYRLLKIDKVDNRGISDEIIVKLKKFLENTKSDAVIFSDFRHGIFHQRSIRKLVSSIPKKVFKCADSQVASRWGNITEFENFDLITPNERECRFALADQDSTVGKLSSVLVKKAKCKNLILKLGNKGVFCTTKSRDIKSQYFSIDSFTNKVVDTVGAGDALLAYSTLSFVATNSIIVASIIGSLAAACECEVDGNIPITVKDVVSKINELENNSEYKVDK